MTATFRRIQEILFAFVSLTRFCDRAQKASCSLTLLGQVSVLHELGQLESFAGGKMRCQLHWTKCQKESWLSMGALLPGAEAIFLCAYPLQHGTSQIHWDTSSFLLKHPTVFFCPPSGPIPSSGFLEVLPTFSTAFRPEAMAMGKGIGRKP